MTWLQLRLQTEKNNADHWSDCLTEVGAVSVSFEDAQDQALFEPKLGTTPLWDHVILIGLFEASIDTTAVQQQLSKLLGVSSIQNARFEVLEDKDWQEAWKAHFKPMQFGVKLWICPSWCEIPQPSAINVLLDPGMAFGTGTHPTTALCLDWLASHLPTDATVIDYGCGSGILGIAAAKLGAKAVHCIDIDPQALSSTKENAKKNNISEEQLFTYLPEEAPEIQADIMIANILANPLIDLSSSIANLTKSNGTIILSGLLDDQADMIIECYQEWFSNFEITTKEQWVRLIATKK